MKVSVSRRTRARAIVVLASLLALGSGLADAQTGTQPGLLAGELLVPVKNCGIIVNYPPQMLARKDMQDGLALMHDYVWTGECRSGLAHGFGELLPQSLLDSNAAAGVSSRSEYVYGRSTGLMTISTSLGTTMTYNLDTRSASLDNIDANFAPVWHEILKEGTDGSTLTYSEYAGDQPPLTIYVSTLLTTCLVAQDQFRGCDYDDDFLVYGLMVNVMGTLTNVWCPEPRTGKGCEALWEQYTGPTIPKIRALLADVEKRGADIRSQAPQQFAAWNAAWAARKSGEAAQSIRGILDRVAALDRDSAAAAAADRAYHAKLAKQNAGELFALADTLRRDGQNDQANEVLRTLVSRFPASPLAGVAAGQLAGSPSGAGGSRSASGPAAYSSVCVRNLQKIDNDMAASNTRQAGASNDLWLRNINQLVAQLFQPCIGYDSYAAQQRDRALKEDARIAQACAGAHSAVECLQWGYGSPDLNRNYYTVFKAEWDRAISDPNFSASLGTAAGPGGGGGSTSATAGGSEPAQRERCRVKLQDLGAAMRGDEARLPADAAVPRLKLILWYTGEARAAIQQICPATAAYADEAKGYATTAAQAQETCDAISSTGRCTAARP